MPRVGGLERLARFGLRGIVLRAGEGHALERELGAGEVLGGGARAVVGPPGVADAWRARRRTPVGERNDRPDAGEGG